MQYRARLGSSWFLIGFAIAACGGPPDANLVRAQPLTWRTLPDGSRVATQEHGAEDRSFWFSDVYRCWPRSGRQDCLHAAESSISGFALSRHIYPDLPTGDEAPAAGYSCSRTKDYGFEEEAISGLKGKLVSNQIGGLDPHDPWSASFVASYMNENGVVGGDPHFACKDLLNLYTGGSLATFESTSISYSRHMR